MAMTAREDLITARSKDFTSSLVVIASERKTNKKKEFNKLKPKGNKKEYRAKRRYPWSSFPKSLLL